MLKLDEGTQDIKTEVLGRNICQGYFFCRVETEGTSQGVPDVELRFL